MAGKMGLHQRFAAPLLKPAEQLPGNTLTAGIVDLGEYRNFFHPGCPLLRIIDDFSSMVQYIVSIENLI
jgi:hypothetical protein